MSNMFDDVEAIVKREMVLFFVIDQSGSMAGERIGKVNTAIREVLPDLRGIGGSDADIKIAVLLFSNGCQWMYDAPISVDTFQWIPVQANGMTDLGTACTELAAKMSKNAFLKAPSASVAPAIILMSDGCPTDEYKLGLDKLWGNNWFKHAIRVALAIDDEADHEVLAEFTGSSEAVIPVDSQSLMKWIRFVTITSSKIGSQSQGVFEGGATQTKQEAVVQMIQEEQHSAATVDPNAADQWD